MTATNTAAGDIPPQMPRKVLFISKATPGDDEFALWLAPRLEAEGYTVFADILSLDAGTRWRKEITSTLRDRSVKMLLCCRDTTLASEGVQEELGIASDLVKQLGDLKFIIPLRLGCGSELVTFMRGAPNTLGDRAFVAFTSGSSVPALDDLGTDCADVAVRTEGAAEIGDGESDRSLTARCPCIGNRRRP
jgi:hypothetical protein